MNSGVFSLGDHVDGSETTRALLHLTLRSYVLAKMTLVVKLRSFDCLRCNCFMHGNHGYESGEKSENPDRRDCPRQPESIPDPAGK